MQVLSVNAFPFSYSQLCFLCCILQTILAQSNPGPRPAHTSAIRPSFTWENNGRVFSLFSRGSKYVPSGVRARETGPQSSVVVISDNNDASEALNTTSIHAQSQESKSSPRRPLVRTQGFPSRSPQGEEQRDLDAPGDIARPSTSPSMRNVGGDIMVGDDPYDPYKSLTNPYYNYYDAYFRPRTRTQERERPSSNSVQHGKMFFSCQTIEQTCHVSSLSNF